MQGTSNERVLYACLSQSRYVASVNTSGEQREGSANALNRRESIRRGDHRDVYARSAGVYLQASTEHSPSLSFLRAEPLRSAPLALLSRVLCVKLQNVRGLARMRCNADHTSIHWKWTSIPVINTSRLYLLCCVPSRTPYHSNSCRSLPLFFARGISPSFLRTFLSCFYWPRCVVIGFFLSLYRLSPLFPLPFGHSTSAFTVETRAAVCLPATCEGFQLRICM